MNYHKIILNIQPRDPWVDLFIDELGEKGCDSFEETPNGFNAYIPSIHFTSELEAFINALSNRGEIKLSYILEEIPSENWNKVWESSFEPIIVGDWCAIIAPFHSGEYNTQHYVKISPKMSFGTGHHETTYMMVQNMQSINLKGKDVLDMGTGTGVLAILAKKMGAQYVEAIDIEEVAVANCIENAQNNHVELNIKKGGKEQISTRSFDVVFANINKNILIDQMTEYAGILKQGGQLVLSGFLFFDEHAISDCAIQHNLTPINKLNKENWLCLAFTKK